MAILPFMLSPVGRFMSSPVMNCLRGGAGSFRSKLNTVNDLFDLASSACSVTRLAPGVSWSESTHQQLSTIESTLGAAQSANNSVQVGCGIVQMLTGGLFFETNPDGSFRVDPVSKQRQLLSPLTALSKVTRLASKILSTARFMGSATLPVYQLGTHARGLGLSALAFGAVSSAFDVADNIQAIHHAVKADPSGDGKTPTFADRCKAARASMFALLCSVLDVVAQGFNFVVEAISSVFLGAHTAFIVGIFCFLSALGNIILALAS